MNLNAFFKKHTPSHLLTRFVLIIIMPLIILQLLVGTYFYNKHWNSISRRLAGDIVGEISLVAKWAETQENPNQHLDIFSSSFGMDFFFQEGGKLPDFKGHKALEAKTLRTEIRNIPYPCKTLTDKESSEQYLYIQLKNGVLKIEIPRKRFFSTTVPSFLLWMFISSCFLFTIAFLFMKNQVRAIVRLANAAESFGLGQEIKFKPEGAAEVRQAGQAFIEMKDRIARYLNERTTMLAGVSHDLRTPLTRMKLALSMMAPDETTQMINQDITEMEQMLTGYLDFTKGNEKEKIQKINLSDFMKTLTEKFERLGFPVSLHIEQPIEFYGRPHELSRALSNVLSNASHYASMAHINLGIREDKVQIIIDDNGPGIPAKKRLEVFKPFYRMESSRNKNTGGVGLGMTITRDIILAHGGNIQLDESPAKGLRVLITFPFNTL